MRNKSLSLFVLIKQNLKNKPVRSIGFILLMTAISFIIFFSLMIASSMINGLDSTEKRLGADILIVPESSESDLSGFLLKGKPSTFYLDNSILKKVKETKGVNQVTTQVDVGTLDAACCASSIQLIGIDTQTDFVVKPWISEVYDVSKLKDDEIIIGNSISGQSGTSLKFFDYNFKVVAKLERTGMGYDTTTFMNQATARKMAKLRAEKVKDAENLDYSKVISTVLVNVNADTTPFLVSKSLSFSLADDSVSIVKSENIIENTSKNMTGLLKMMQILGIIISIFTLIIIGVLLVVAMNERRKEFAVLRMLGMKKSMVTSMIIGELAVISFSGIAIGISSGALIFYLFKQAIQNQIASPFLSPTVYQLALAIGWTILSIFIISLVASGYSVMKINRIEVSALIREE